MKRRQEDPRHGFAELLFGDPFDRIERRRASSAGRFLIIEKVAWNVRIRADVKVGW